MRRTCEHELEIRKMVRLDAVNASLRDHAANCDACRETLQVTVWMQKLAAEAMPDSPPSDPEHLWWKGEMLRRLDAQRRAVAPIEIGERVQLGIGFVGAVALLASLWHDSSNIKVSTSLTVGFISGVILLVTITATTIHRLTARE
jgi:hypothetical protein